MPEAHIHGTRSGSGLRHAWNPVDAAREGLIDSLTEPLHQRLPLLLTQTLGVQYAPGEVVVYAHDLYRASSINALPIEVRLEPGSRDGEYGAEERRALADALDAFVNGEWFPTVAGLAAEAGVRRIEIVVGFHDTAGVTYDKETGKRDTWG